MDDMKLRLSRTVAGKLGAAPACAAKDELIEELSDNLYRRFLDMTGAGVPEEEAFRRALDDLGDVNELLAYLGAEPAGDAAIGQREGQTRATSSSGKTVVINNRGGGERTEGGQSDLDAILSSLSAACNTAVDQAKEALKQAKGAIQRRTSVEKDKGRVKIHFNTTPEEPGPARAAEAPEAGQPQAGEAPRPTGWEFEAELNPDQGRFYAGGGPKERTDVAYGFGYDKERGGFFAQWGQLQGESRTGPRFIGEGGAAMEHNENDSYSVTALKDLRGIEVSTRAGDVTIHMSEAPGAGVIIDGDVDDLDVTCSADGVLTIREGRTASSSFFSRRGFSSADVELYLPRRRWDTITVSTASGDVAVDRGELDVDQLTVATASGDLSARLSACGVLSFKSASGDLDLTGNCGRVNAETMSGDVSLTGRFQEAALKSVSGEIDLEGLVERLLGQTMSGDVSVDASAMPQAMELSSKSGDVEARIPDGGPFTVRMKTVSGEMDSDFPLDYVNGVHTYSGGSGPAYSMTSVSGDVSLTRR